MTNRRSVEDWVALIKECSPSLLDSNEIIEHLSTEKDKLYVKCKVCGYERHQATYSLKKGCGCKKCSAKSAGSKTRLSTEQFITNVLNRFPDNTLKFDYSKTEYFKANNKLIIGCRTCGKDFHQTANDHYGGKGCSHCVGRNCTTETFVDKVLTRFPENANNFIYDKVVYVGDNKPVSIGCRLCGEYFTQTPTKHYQGHGCNLHAGSNGGFKVDRQGYLYITKWQSPFGDFIKVGITSVGSENRASKQKVAGYSFDVVFEHKADGSFIMELESFILKTYEDSRRYLDKNVFPDGYTETFNPELLDEIVSSAKEYINEQSS